MPINTVNPTVPTLDRNIPVAGLRQEQTEQDSRFDQEYMDWLKIARDAYTESIDYYESSLRTTMGQAYAHFRSTHPQGSRYYHKAYKFREKNFIPKTRAAIDNSVASAAQAFFSTQDVASFTAMNPNDEEQVISAQIMRALIDFRLESSIPWFQILCAAMQGAEVTGTVLSKQYWKYKESRKRHKRIDTPCVKLYPIEAIRFDPAADFIDPVNSSPYIIIDEPMYLYDVRKMQRATKNVEWIEISDDELSTAFFHHDETESTRREREGRHRADTYDHSKRVVKEYRLLDIREYIVEKEGQDYVFWTAGDLFMLSRPMPLEKIYIHDIRPFVIGHTDIEAHRIYPDGLPVKAFGSQERINRIANLRLDNWALSVNKRYLSRRDSTTNFRALHEVVPGGVIEVDDPINDIKEIPVSDIGPSAYREQEMASTEFDSLFGATTPENVQGNRNIPQGPNAKNLLAPSADIKMEYRLRMFAETWVEPVIRQLVRLEQEYESDETVLDIAASRANLLGRYGIPKITSKMLKGDLLIRLNVGFGATTPDRRISRIAMALQTIGQFSPQLASSIDSRQIVSEVMGALGWRDGARFFPSLIEGNEDYIDPLQAQARVEELEQELQALQEQLVTKQTESQTKIQVEQMRQQGAMERESARYQSHIQIAGLRAQLQRDIAAMKAQSELIKARVAAEKNEIARDELMIQLQDLENEMNVRGLELLQTELDREQRELSELISRGRARGPQ